MFYFERFHKFLGLQWLAIPWLRTSEDHFHRLQSYQNQWHSYSQWRLQKQFRHRRLAYQLQIYEANLHRMFFQK